MKSLISLQIMKKSPINEYSDSTYLNLNLQNSYTVRTNSNFINLSNIDEIISSTFIWALSFNIGIMP